MSIIFDILELEQKDEFLSKLESGIRGTRGLYARINQALTQEEKNALINASDTGRYTLLAGLDQVGLLDWYYEQKAIIEAANVTPSDSSS